jgi:hypothetical protein
VPPVLLLLHPSVIPLLFLLVYFLFLLYVSI